MAVYKDSEQLYVILKSLFTFIKDDDPESVKSVSSAHLIIRLHFKQPEAEVWINGRKNPVTADYCSSSLRPDLDVELSADAFHQIMLGTLPLGKALASGQMKVRGPVYKSFVLQDIFHRGQAIYPQLAEKSGIA